MKQDVKAWTLSVIKTCSKEFALFISNVPKKEREIKGELKAWSTKDQMAHLTFWFEVFVKNIDLCRNGKPLISTKDYLAMNDSAWKERKDLPWSEIEKNFTNVVHNIEIEINRLHVEELIDGKTFSVEPHRNPPRPLIKSLFYEMIDHPFKHITKQYIKFGDKQKAKASLKNITSILKQPGFSKWTTSSLGNIRKLDEGLN